MRTNRLRSGLTLLGVIIGVTSVMTIISALEGLTGSIEREIEQMGPSTFMIGTLLTAMSEQEALDKFKRKPLDYEAVQIIEDGCEVCDKVAPRAARGEDLKYRDQSMYDIVVVGATYHHVEIYDLEVDQGRFHSYEDDLYRRRVAFIGAGVYEKLYEGLDPLGKDIWVGNQKYTVIGVAKKKGSVFGASQDEFVYVPFDSFRRQFGISRRGLYISVKARSVDQLQEAMDEVRVLLRSQRHVPFDQPDDFDMLTAESLLTMLNSLTKILRFGLVGISSISLVVGGIVVMNIMMVSVTERTREIGIRKSVGAKRRHILTQFLFEAVILTLSGGIVGIVAGFLIASALVGMLNVQMNPSALAITAGLTVSTGTGLVFGIYPALKAARLDPIKALSYE
ncbi:MAG: ABC transporter permease [Candidatus Zixiibacteriota bacterium]|nr:MAG: ABC transporter permease [candidate division Zixibacteria bacterium]